MTQTDLVEEISHFLKQRLGVHRIRRILKNTSFFHELASKFQLKCICAQEGTYRRVFKQKGTNTVIKIGHAYSNRSEWVAWNTIKPFNLSSILAECLAISKDGTVLQQEFLPKRLPLKYDGIEFSGYEHGLNDIFLFMGDNLDFHSDNIRITANGDCRISDYAAMLDLFFAKHRRSKGIRLTKNLQEVFKNNDKKVQFYLNHKKELVLNVE